MRSMKAKMVSFISYPRLIECVRQEIFCSFGSSQFHPDGTSVRLNRQTKPQERTALSLEINHRRKLLQPPSYGRKTISVTIFEFSYFQNRTPDLFQNCVSSLRSEEHTSELQSQSNIVCRLLLEKKKSKM